jgi:hypothetical protein
MNILFVPSIGLDVSLLERLSDSIDYPVNRKVVYNNGPTGALEGFRESHPDWIVKEPAFGNRGVAGSWNDCAKMFADDPTMLLMNEDAYFLPGYLEKICKCADAHLGDAVIHLNDSNAYYCFVWTQAGRETYGTFDENLWPAYYEDCDMRIRHRLMGVHGYTYALQGLPPLPHGKPSTGGINYSAMMQGCGLLNRQYWVRKWGSLNYEQATYQTPYKDDRLTPANWEWYPEHRAKLFPLWESFMAQSPSIYD